MRRQQLPRSCINYSAALLNTNYFRSHMPGRVKHPTFMLVASLDSDIVRRHFEYYFPRQTDPIGYCWLYSFGFKLHALFLYTRVTCIPRNLRGLFSRAWADKFPTFYFCYNNSYENSFPGGKLIPSPESLHQQARDKQSSKQRSCK